MQYFTQKKQITLAFIALVFITAVQSNATIIVAPGSQANAEGITANGAPFSSNVSLTSMRNQQAFSSDHFSALNGPGLITQIAFRPDYQYGASFSSVLPDIQINMATTLKDPEALDTVFANNVGADNTVVFTRGALALSSAFSGPIGGPKDFDIVITLSTPFLYDPSKGNLLLDVRNYATVMTTFFDAAYSYSDGTGRVLWGDVNSSAGTVGALGLVTQFTIQPVPEPSTYLVGLCCLGILGSCAWRKRS